MKLKRLLTGVLSAVMALSVCAMPALAETVSTSTINKEKLGSITIYKYAQTADQEDESKDKVGNGEVITDTGNISGTKLPNAEFTVYRVKNTDELMEYYAGIQNGSTKEFTVDECFVTGKDQTADNLKDDYKGTNAVEDKTVKGKVATDSTNSEGMVTFGSLPVGLYLVIETRVPESVTTPTKPFLVSIPMTREGTDNKNKQWLYDVTVYPKNSTVEGTVTLRKKGFDGTTTVNLSDVKFKLWKYDETDKTYKEITLTKGITTGANGEVKIENLVKGRYVLQETEYEKNKDKGYILNTKGIYAFLIDENGKVAENKIADDNFAGISNCEKVEVGNGFELDATNATITITNYKPDFKKNVTKRDETDSANNESHDADYAVGEAVPYTLTIKVPANVAKLHTFKVTDTALAEQLVQNLDSIHVVGKTKGGTEVKFEASDYSPKVEPSSDGKNSIMTIDFAPQDHLEKMASVAGGEITIIYTSTLKEKAVIAGAGNLNTADLSYSRTTDTSKGESSDTGNEPYQIEDRGVVYSFELNIEKTAQGGNLNKQKLNGVTFDLYKKASDGDRGTDGKYYFRGKECEFITGVAASNIGLAQNDVWLKVATLKTVDGVDKVSGLPAGEYKLVETQTVDGYNLLSEPVDAKLEIGYETQWETKIQYDGNGKEIKRNYTATTYKRDSNTIDNDKVSEPLKIVNRAGFTLPVTGGFGTLLFSGIGVLLVLAGVCVLFSMKKKNNRT